MTRDEEVAAFVAGWYNNNPDGQRAAIARLEFMSGRYTTPAERASTRAFNAAIASGATIRGALRAAHVEVSA